MPPPANNTSDNDSKARDSKENEDTIDTEGFETPKFMLTWSDKQKADFAFQLLTTLPPYHVIQLVDRISPYLHRNLLAQFPVEIAIHILSFLDGPSLAQASLVSKGWRALCEEQNLWKILFEGQGWEYDRNEIQAYLANNPSDEEYHAGSIVNVASTSSNAGSSGNTGSGSSSNNDAQVGCSSRAISSVPIERTSAPLISRNKWRRIYNLKNKSSPSSRSATKRSHQPPPNDELLEYHYDLESDTRFINWQRLYRNRYQIEQQWKSGSCNTYHLPPESNPRGDAHTDGIYCLQLDKEKIVTGSRDQTIKIWNIKSGRCIQSLRGHAGSVLCLQYDADTIVSGSSDSTLIITDIDTGLIKKRLRGHGDSVLSLRLVGNNQVISCSKDRTLRLWDRQTGECVKEFRSHNAAVNAVQWHDTRIISASGDRTIKIWDLNTGECTRTLAAHTRGVACVEFDGKYIVSGSSDQTIKVWDSKTGDCIYTLVGHTDLVRTIQLDSVGDRIISGCYSGKLKLWSLSKGRLLRDLGQATDGRILNLKFDSTRLVCCSNSQYLVVYDFTHDISTKFLL